MAPSHSSFFISPLLRILIFIYLPYTLSATFPENSFLSQLVACSFFDGNNNNRPTKDAESRMKGIH